MSSPKSKPRSATTLKPHRRRVDPAFSFPPIYIDECASQVKLAAQLVSLGFQVHTALDTFPDIRRGDLDDPTWLLHCGREGWLVLTKDKAIKRRAAEFRMLKVAKVRMFTISAGNLTGEDQAALVAAAIPAMRRFVKNQPAPFLVRLMAGARTELVALK